MKPERHFQTSEPDGTPTEKIQNHKNGVLGHLPDASSDWNNGGHKRSRKQNNQHNKETGTYHGIESRARSDASGSSAPGYRSPRPDIGSHRSHFDPTHPEFKSDVPWHTWKRVPGQQPGNSNNNNAGPSVQASSTSGTSTQPSSSSGHGFMPSVQTSQRPQTSGSSTYVRPQAQLSQMAPPTNHNQQQFGSQPVLSPFMTTPSSSQQHQQQLSSMGPSAPQFPPVQMHGQQFSPYIGHQPPPMQYPMPMPQFAPYPMPMLPYPPPFLQMPPPTLYSAPVQQFQQHTTQALGYSPYFQPIQAPQHQPPQQYQPFLPPVQAPQQHGQHVPQMQPYGQPQAPYPAFPQQQGGSRPQRGYSTPSQRYNPYPPYHPPGNGGNG
jgi:hypothetical protein